MIYIRPYPDLFISYAQMQVHNPDGQFIPGILLHIQRARVLADVFGRENVSSRIFSRWALLKEDVLTDFQEWLSRQVGVPVPVLENFPSLNQAKSAECCALLVNLYWSLPGRDFASDRRAVADFLRRHQNDLPNTKLSVPQSMAARLSMLGAQEWNDELAHVSNPSMERSSFMMPVSPVEVAPFSKAEVLGWLASHWSESYLDAAIALAESRSGPAAKKVADLLKRTLWHKAALDEPK